MADVSQVNLPDGSSFNVKDAVARSTKADKVAPPAEYDDTATYVRGDFCTYNGNTYVCKTTISTAEAWNADHWRLCDAQQDYLHSLNPVGNGSFSLNRKSATTIGAFSFAEGYNNTASGNYSHAEGVGTTASATTSHAEGNSTTASSTAAHAEGYNTMASGTYSHAEGYGITASGNGGSHAEGYHTSASGDFGAHAEGISTIASGDYGAHAEGVGTTANLRAQHTFGEYNVLDPSTAESYNRGNYVEIVGNGTADNARSNVRTLDWNGNEVLAGGLKINGTQNVATQVSLTQAEYDALSTAQKNNGNFYLITDADPSYFSAENIDYDNTSSGLSATNIQGAIDDINSVIPAWIKQTAGSSITITVPFTFCYYYADQWSAHIQFPFITKNNTYSVTLASVIAENVGEIVSKCSVVEKQYTYFDIRTTKTMSSLPDIYSTCVGRCRFTITFA